ncbi:glycosyltransferase PgfM1 [Streptococcus macacae]|uniref:Bacterial membrane protein YfhO n=1 Tax=Streptococcus macacae NCTC 11558 TaxID=764298 RepID=G5JWX7_9STRE|nr:YfhO family protein [Streptococcus macacae]EHJ52477.1 bacterial membrane protein YfhO [Streptococcus macacae NCTC 11558]SUN79453.1 transmembrane protein [Streptococcus macacae NCTC 11558]
MSRSRTTHKQKKDFSLTKKSQVLWASALLPMLIMLVVWLFMGVFPFGRNSLMAVDFGQQYIGLYGFLKETVLTGDWSGLFYSFSKSIGGAMIGVWGFNLISPFNLFYILLPLSQFKWAVFLTIWLRYGAMGLSFAYLLIKRYKALSYNHLLIPVMATAYALSGMIVSYQMNPIFYDAMIMLPLVILCLEELIDGGKPFKYILVLALTMLFHFYMGYMICLFIALYSCYYAAPKLAGEKAWKTKLLDFLKPLWRVICYSVLAITSVFFLLYPIFLNLLRSKGAYDSPMTFSFALQINPLDILSKLMIGGFDNDSSWSAGPNLPNVYIGALALIGFFLYFTQAKAHKFRKAAAALIGLIFFVSFVNEFVNKIWHMGQNPAGFFFRFSWLLSFFMVLLAYLAIREGKYLSWKGLVAGIIFSFAAVYYVSGQNYTYLPKYQPTAVTNYVNSHQLIVLIIALLIFGALAYYAWTHLKQYRETRICTVAACLLAIPVFLYLLNKGFLLTQVSLTLMTWLFVLVYLALRPKNKWVGLALLAMTVFELGYNAYLSQVTLAYTDAYKFTDISKNMKELSDVIKKKNKAGFYRVGSSFLYAKNDPFLVSYPGLSSFSSNMEKSTINLFNSMGDVGGNAATFYANGTPLTDALYGVRYYMDAKNYTTSDIEKHPNWYLFNRNATRSDLKDYYHPIYHNNRFTIYENPNVFSAAFGTNTLTRNIKFGLNNPVSNQNIILSSMSGANRKYFEYIGIPRIELINMQEVNENGHRIFKRIDKKQAGTVRIIFTPQTNHTYYFQAPYSLRKSMGNVSIMLNNQWYHYSQSYDQVQLWNLANKAKGQTMTFQLQTSKEDQLDLTNMALVRADQTAIKKVLQERRKQNMTVTKWTNTLVKGHVNITDQSNVMMTSIPYNPGWTVKVDGKKVKTSEAWGSLLSFPITSGKHRIEMSFRPQGLLIGLAVSFISLLIIVFLKWRDHSQKV